MALKIFFIVAIIYAIQVFTAGPVKALGLPGAYMQAEKEKDDFGLVITFGDLEIPLKKNQRKIAECYSQQKEKYQSVASTYALEAKNLAKELGESMTNGYSKVADNAKNYLDKIAYTMNTYPPKLDSHMQERKYFLAAGFIKQTKNRINYYDMKFNAEMKRINEEASHIAEPFIKKYKNIREKARDKAKIINFEFSYCLMKASKFNKN